jgi:hypothetical protein
MLLPLGVVLGLVLMLGACGGSGSKSGTPATSTPGTGHVAIPVGANPSLSAQMVCEKTAVDDIAQVVGVNTVSISKPTWNDHVYSCDYVYPAGARMTLSVKEMSDADQTTAYFNMLSQKLGHKQDIQGIGQGAFVTSNGNMVVRKDYKVLTVDVSHLPASFGVPSDTREHMAINVAATIMGCWTGE